MWQCELVIQPLERLRGEEARKLKREAEAAVPFKDTFPSFQGPNLSPIGPTP
jgi:hypothetical protein